MKAVIQRVAHAAVEVDGEVVGKIGKGFLILLGVADGDSERDCEKLTDKIAHMRIFADENDKVNLALDDVGGDVLAISQFTLYADCRRGNRPGFTLAGKPEHAQMLYGRFCEMLERKIKGNVERGVFGADMKVSLLNDGPFTIILECVDGQILL